MIEKDYVAREYMGARIKTMREMQGMTLEGLAEITGLKPNNIKRIEQGRYDVGIDVLSLLAKALGARLTIQMQG